MTMESNYYIHLWEISMHSNPRKNIEITITTRVLREKSKRPRNTNLSLDVKNRIKPPMCTHTEKKTSRHAECPYHPQAGEQITGK